MWNDAVDFSDLVGKTLVKVEVDERNDKITFVDTEGNRYDMYHNQDCCESVYIESVVGDVSDLLNTEIYVAAEVTHDDPAAGECGMWTFYKLATLKGYVDIRWYGSSNGYYGVGVGFYKSKFKD